MWFTVDHALAPRERELLRRLERDYTEELLRSVLVPLITQAGDVSLRVLDYAVVSWSKTHRVLCSSAAAAGTLVNVHEAYLDTLHYWRRRLFDPFRRRARVRVEVDGAVHTTTLGQANFALWLHRTGILAFVLSNLARIEADMNRAASATRARRKVDRAMGRRKRRLPSPARRTTCVVFPAPGVETFDGRTRCG